MEPVAAWYALKAMRWPTAFSGGGVPISTLPTPKTAIFATNARPLPLRRFRPGGMLPSEQAEPPLRIVFPPNGARLELAAAPGQPAEAIMLKIAGGTQPPSVLVNGVPLAAGADRRKVFFSPASRASCA